LMLALLFAWPLAGWRFGSMNRAAPDPVSGTNP
jgi:hypothetical protein